MDFTLEIIGVILGFSTLMTVIITKHLRSQTNNKTKMLQQQFELEKIKQENYLLETERLRLELEKMKLEAPKDEFLIHRD